MRRHGDPPSRLKILRDRRGYIATIYSISFHVWLIWLYLSNIIARLFPAEAKFIDSEWTAGGNGKLATALDLMISLYHLRGAV